jgi:hypothetical protein
VSLIVVGTVLELAIIAGSWLDTHLRPGPYGTPWAARWFYWHIAPAWLAWLGLVSGLRAAAVRAARASYERHALAHTDGTPLLAIEDRWPHDGPAVSAVSDGAERQPPF